jgi:phospholipid transport system transporter-binding protein
MITADGDRYRVEGPVTMTNVTATLAESERVFNRPRLVIDLAGVSEVDSAAVSLLLEWRRKAAAQARQLEFVNLPANLKSLAELYGVSELLGIS